MAVLKTEGTEENYPSLACLLSNHPEIDEACLIYTINRVYEVEEYDGTICKICGDIVDWEYSYVGSRADDDGIHDALANFAIGYGVWDDAEMRLEGTSLIGSQEGWDPDIGEYPDKS